MTKRKPEAELEQKSEQKPVKKIFNVDWDNTMNEFGVFISGVIHKVINQMEKNDSESKENKEKYDAMRQRTPKIPTKSRAGTLRDVFGDGLDLEAMKILDAIKDENPYDAKPMEGAGETMRLLAEAHQRGEADVCILSNKVTPEIKADIKKMGWDEYMVGIPVVGGDVPKGEKDGKTVPLTKPHPQHALEGLKALYPQLPENYEFEIIFIGDGLDSDIEAARKFNAEAQKLNLPIKCQAILLNAQDEKGIPRYNPEEYQEYLNDGTIKDPKNVVTTHKELQARIQEIRQETAPSPFLQAVTAQNFSKPVELQL